ncbi:MAG: acetylxylan esterase [Clostridia bacterium]|nr:acetylxylan esterase [Clostridia bacterium]
MPNVDIKLSELKKYKPDLTQKADFEAFWRETLEESSRQPLNSELIPHSYPVSQIKAFNIYYDGFRGSRINGWYLLPNGADKDHKVPIIIYYHGYTKNKGYIVDYLKWLIQGYAVLAVDVRGQGGKTADPAVYSRGGIAGWMTKGILDKYQYYYRNVFVDCVRAIDFACEREEIDTEKIGIYGFSQGGGITLAVAALDKRPKFAIPIEPYLCNFRRGGEVYQEGPYGEISDYFRILDPEMQTEEDVFDTLSYFDGMNMASRIKCPVLMAVGLVDKTCPPSTVFAAYNHLECEKQIKIYHHHDHEVPSYHEEVMIEFVKKQFE